MASLFVIQGSDKGKRFELRAASSCTIGRDPSNPIRIHDNEVSRKHAEVQPLVGETYRLVDLESANGTYLNGELIASVPLHSGDRVQIGQTVLIFSPGPTSAADLTERVDLLARANPEDRSAILHSIAGQHPELGSGPRDARNEWLKARMAHLSVLYEATQAISHIVDPDELLPQILQLVFQSVHADRAVILLGDPGKPLEPKAVRWRAHAEPEERLSISQTIVDHVRETGDAVVTTDAPADTRFAPSKSITDFAIREAICAPVRGRHSTLGVLYADALGSLDSLSPDTRPERCRFSQEHLMLMIAIGQHAGLALENTDFYRAKLQSERMAAIGQTITAISHSIKNILQGLRGGSYLIDQGLRQNDDATVRRGWAVVEKNQNKIYNMVLDMLSFSKEREPMLEPADLNQTIGDVIELLTPRAQEAGVSLAWAPNPTLPTVHFDTEAIHRAVLNIVSNAIDACEHAATKRVEVKIDSDPASQTVRILVSDTGAGIAEADLATIFEAFVSSKGARGTGLGLPVSHKILREHGGDLTARSKIGHGTEFELTLPLRQPPEVQATLSEE